MTTAVLTTLPSSLDANLLKSKLESEGIKCFLVNENFTDWFPAYFGLLGAGVQVVVRNEDVPKAREFAQLTTGPVTCPSCGSKNVLLKHEKFKRKLTLLFIGLLLTSLFGNLLIDYNCNDCNVEFR